MGFGPYFPDGTTPATTGQHGFLRVRVSNDIQSTGYVAVYLDTGTQLVVHTHEVLVFEADERDHDVRLPERTPTDPYSGGS